MQRGDHLELELEEACETRRRTNVLAAKGVLAGVVRVAELVGGAEHIRSPRLLLTRAFLRDKLCSKYCCRWCT